MDDHPADLVRRKKAEAQDHRGEAGQRKKNEPPSHRAFIEELGEPLDHLQGAARLRAVSA